jgi:hypothetical protein
MTVIQRVCASITLSFPTVNAPFKMANAPFQNVNKREKMFAVSAWMQMAVYVYISFLLFIKTLAM